MRQKNHASQQYYVFIIFMYSETKKEGIEASSKFGKNLRYFKILMSPKKSFKASTDIFADFLHSLLH